MMDGWMGGSWVVGGVLGQIFNSITCQRNKLLLLSLVPDFFQISMLAAIEKLDGQD